MDERVRSRASVAMGVVAALAVAACARHEARDFRGRWVPLNAWANETSALPLHPVHVFEATPMDGTLRALLARWVRDGGATLDYRHPDDFILHGSVAAVRATTLEAAVARLGGAFAQAGVAMRVEDGRIVVEPAVATAGPATPRRHGRGGS